MTAFSLDASEFHGAVRFGGLPVPGATVTAVKGDQTMTAVTDAQGAYTFPDLADGTWNLSAEMLGFGIAKQDVTVAPNAPAAELELKMLSFSEMHADVKAVTQPAVAAAPTPETPNPAKPAPAKPGAFQRTEVNATNANAKEAPPAPGTDAAAPATSELSQRAADGFLVNGSVNNGASSPFAQFAAFGNGRRAGRSLYSGGIGFTLDNSALDARQFSFTGQDTPKPGKNNLQGLLLFNGPIKIPHILRNGPLLTINYQWLRNRNASTLSALMPTQDQRNGVFAGPVVDPLSGLPFPNNLIPQTRFSPQARALLGLYPLPNFPGSTQYNYQIPVVIPTHQDSLQSRINKQVGRKDQLFGLLAFQSTRANAPNVFGFLDTTKSLGINTNANWRHSITPRLYLTLGTQFSRYSIQTIPFFANRQNVSGLAGITGNLQDAANWGPPSLNFGSGIASLGDAQYSANHNQTAGVSAELFYAHRAHNFTSGLDFKRQQNNVLAQQDPRGTFSFTGASTGGSDFGGFLLGIPDASSIAFGNADKYFRYNTADAYFNDDWRVRSGLTVNIGIRWEYGSPVSELQGRLVNLDVAGNFNQIAPVLGLSPNGSLTNQSLPGSLVRPDRNNFAPRGSFAWRPLAASSMIVRGSYGIYYDTSVYQPIATAMSQQAPLSTSLRVSNTPATPLTLANGFGGTGLNTPTFGIDPNFRIGYAQIWLVSVQRDLPFALQMTAAYTGTKGTRSVQQFLPNTYAAGAINPCPGCPSGFTYMTSNGDSTREAGQINLRRRLRSGFTAELQYVYSKSIDDAALGGRIAGGSAANQGTYLIAQDWTNLSAERALSNFDQRHAVTATAQYTSGQGIRGGTLLSGWRGTLLKEWTVSTQITAGTGLPLSPVYFAATGNSGVIGSLRPDYTGASLYSNSLGLNLNPAAFVQPTGHYGNAGRNIITGPDQFTMAASLARTFRINDRFNANLRFDSNNPINHVTYPSWVTTVGSQQFGLPLTANGMRTIQTTVRVTF